MNSCIKRAQSGDKKALKDLVEHLRPRLTKLAHYYGRCCGEDPDDLLQEAWVGLLDALPQVDLGIGSPEQYLIARARWRVLDVIKRQKVRRCAPLEEDFLEAFNTTDPTETTHEVCNRQFAGSLKQNQQKVLECLLSGLTWRETGEVLGCASANIAYHVKQIRRRYVEWADDTAASI